MNALNEKQQATYSRICESLRPDGKIIAEIMTTYWAESNISKFNKTGIDSYDAFSDDNYAETLTHTEEKLIELIALTVTDSNLFDYCQYLSGKHLGKSKALDDFARDVLQRKLERPKAKTGNKACSEVRDILIYFAILKCKNKGLPLGGKFDETVFHIAEKILIEVFRITCNAKNIYYKKPI